MNKEQKKNRMTRRNFLLSATGTAAAFTIVPRYVLGGPVKKPPSEKLNIAGIGVGNQGGRDIDSVGTENIVALCDVDDKYAANAYKRYPKAKKYYDFRRMLEKEDKNIDAVVVATPDHTHAVASMMAIKMGKHIHCEKPLTRSVYEARKLTEAAREYNVISQMGNDGHSGEGIRLICEWIWDGAIGPVREVHAWTDRPAEYWKQGVGRPQETPPVPDTLKWDLWLGPSPQRPYHPIYAPFSWRGWWDFGTGALGDMGCHIIDPAFWALDLDSPESVRAVTTSVNEETYPRTSIVEYEFGSRGSMPPLKLTWYDGGLKPTRPPELEPKRRLGTHGVIFVGDKGKLMCGVCASSPRLIPEKKMQQYELPPKTIPRVKSHMQNWVQCCKTGKQASSHFDYAGPLTEMVLLGNVAIRAGRKLYWDSKNMKCTNYLKANEYLHFEYTKGWSL